MRVNAKSLTNSALILLSALLAHTVACGNFINLVGFAVLGTATVLILAIFESAAKSSWQFFLLALCGQAAAHYLLGSSASSMPGMKMPPNMQPLHMLLAHCAAALLNYLFLLKNEIFWRNLSISVIKFFTLTFRPIFAVRRDPLNIWLVKYLGFSSLTRTFLREAVSRLSAPPIYS